MPTQEEFTLYERMAGGTGDIEQDAHIARHLQRIVNVPEREIVAFVRTRDRDTVHKLRCALKEMPRGQEMLMGGPRAGMRSQPPGQSAMHSDATKARLREVAGSWRSTYLDQCVGDGKPARRTGDLPFDGIVRKGFKPYLDKWRQQTDESKVNAFADACRSLRVFVTSKGPPTCYKEDFPRYADAHIKPPVDNRDQKNLSCVPMGCIGHFTSMEQEAKKARDHTFRDMIAAAYKREEDILNGDAFKNKQHLKCCFFPPAPEASAEQCLKGGMAFSRDWKSEGKNAWNNDVHSKRSAMRYGITHSKRGATKLALEGCAAELKSFKRQSLQGGQRASHSMPSLSSSS